MRYLVAVLAVGCGGHGASHAPDAPADVVADVPADAAPLPAITWQTSQKIEQVIGDIDWASCTPTTGTCTPTASKTLTQRNVLGNGLGYSFEYQGQLIFLFGDTIPTGTWDGTTVGNAALDFHGKDPFASSTSSDPAQALVLTFFPDPAEATQPLFITPTDSSGARLPFAGDDIPNSGIQIGSDMELVYSTGSMASCTGMCDPHAMDYSVLVKYDPANAAAPFPVQRPISALTNSLGAHFIIDSLHAGAAGDSTIYTFGIGDPKNSAQLPDAPANIYLAADPEGAFVAGGQTRYLLGLDATGAPMWSSPGAPEPATLYPIVVDNPNNDTPAPPPSASNLSVIYASDLQLWLMTFDGGKYTAAGYPTDGIYFTYAASPWGPWQKPQLIYNACRDGGFGTYIHYNSGSACPTVAAGAGPVGPMIGANDPTTQRGGAFAPQMIERFTRYSAGVLTIDYTMSTWNPYTVVRMRSTFRVQ